MLRISDVRNRRAIICFFLLLFLLAGTIGHDPWWKRGEAYGFGIIYHFYLTHTWLIPVDAGTPFLEKPPLYYWTAVLFCKLFGWALPLHDAARLASVFYTLITLVFTYYTALQLFRNRADCKTLASINFALFLGTYGILQYSHALLTDNTLLTGTVIALYGMSVLVTEQDKWRKAGVWIGVGVGVAFMAKGFVVPGILVVSGIILYALLPILRSRNTTRAMATMIFVVAPFLLIWPLLLYRESPDLFLEWFWDNNIGRFFGFSVDNLGAQNDRGHFFTILLTFSFPSLPFACFEAWRARTSWRAPEYCLPLVISVIGIVVLFMSASFRTPYLMPLIPAFSLLATQAFVRMSARANSAIGLFLKVAFSASLFVAWLLWWSLTYSPASRPLAWLPELFSKGLALNYVPTESHIVSITTACLATLVWVFSLMLERKNAWDTVRTWFIGAAVLWSVYYTLMMPWINETRSFRTILGRFDDYISQSPYKDSCVGNYLMGENIPPMLQYFTGHETAMPITGPNKDTCPVLLTFADLTSSADIDARWTLIWRDSGFSDLKGMELRLYERKH